MASHLTRNLSRKPKFRTDREPKPTPQSRASEAQVDLFQKNLHALMVEIYHAHEGSPIAGLSDAIEVNWRAVVAAFDLAIAGGAVPAAPPVPVVIPVDPRVPVPAGMSAAFNAAYARWNSFYDTAIASALAVVPVRRPRQIDWFDSVQIPQEDFDLVLYNGLLDLVESGASSHATCTQQLMFWVEDFPPNPEYMVMELNDFATCAPKNVTKFRLVAAYANMIAMYIQSKEDYVTNWASAHHVPGNLRHLGFSAWQHATDFTVALTVDQRKIMEAASSHAFAHAASDVYDNPEDLSSQSEAQREYYKKRLLLASASSSSTISELPDAFLDQRMGSFRTERDERERKRKEFLGGSGRST